MIVFISTWRMRARCALESILLTNRLTYNHPLKIKFMIQNPTFNAGQTQLLTQQNPYNRTTQQQWNISLVTDNKLVTCFYGSLRPGIGLSVSKRRTRLQNITGMLLCPSHVTNIQGFQTAKTWFNNFICAGHDAQGWALWIVSHRHVQTEVSFTYFLSGIPSLA